MVTIWLELYKFQFIEQNKQTPTDLHLKSVGVNLCLLRYNYSFLDRRGRRSLQEISKLPYEKSALAPLF